MPNAIKWEGAMVSHTNVLTTELNALAAGGTGGWSGAFSNNTVLSTFFWVEIGHGTKTEDAHVGDTVEIYISMAPDGSNYQEGVGILVAVVPTDVIAANTLHIYTSLKFELPPCAIKFALKNTGSHAMLDTTNYVELFSSNKEIQ